jgi:preprotein translocase subunit SecF
MFNIVRNRRYYFILSLAIILPGVIAMIYNIITLPTHTPWKLSVDFREGSHFVLKFTGPADESKIRAGFEQFGLTNPSISHLGDPSENLWQVRTTFLPGEQTQQVLSALSERVAPLDQSQSSVDSVSPTVAREVAQAAILAVLAAVVAILLFIWYSFRKAPHAIRYSVSAIIAMVHDILIVSGLMAIFSIVLNWEVDVLFLTAMMTVVAFSIEDKIVVFDRIRENLVRHRGEPYEQIVSRSLVETLHRSLIVSLTNFFVTSALLLFGGASLRQFVAILLIGLVVCTYSSIFNAAPLVVAWEEHSLFGKRQPAPGALPAK